MTRFSPSWTSSLTSFDGRQHATQAAQATLTTNIIAMASSTASSAPPAPPPCPSSIPLPSKSQVCASYLNQPLSSIPTPALVLDRAVIRGNCARMAYIASNWGVTSRAHVKTHKTEEATKEMMMHGQGSGRISISTLAEGWGIVASGLIKERVVWTPTHSNAQSRS